MFRGEEDARVYHVSNNVTRRVTGVNDGANSRINVVIITLTDDTKPNRMHTHLMKEDKEQG